MFARYWKQAVGLNVKVCQADVGCKITIGFCKALGIGGELFKVPAADNHCNQFAPSGQLYYLAVFRLTD